MYYKAYLIPGTPLHFVLTLSYHKRVVKVVEENSRKIFKGLLSQLV